MRWLAGKEAWSCRATYFLQAGHPSCFPNNNNKALMSSPETRNHNEMKDRCENLLFMWRETDQGL